MNARGIAFEELEGDIIEKIRARQSAQERGRAYQEPNPILALFAEFADGRTYVEDNYRRHLKLREKYDATALDLGLSTEQVREVLGVPAQSERLEGDKVLHVYGQEAETGVFPIPWVSVEYEGNRAIAIFTNYTIGGDLPSS